LLVNLIIKVSTIMARNWRL